MVAGEVTYGDDDGRPSPMLCTDSVQSVVIINPAPQSSATLPAVDLRKRRQNPFLNSSKSQRRTSVAISSLSFNSGGDDETGFNTTTLVAACNGGAKGRIHLATIDEGPIESDARVRMKYSSKADDDTNSSFVTVCIASAQSKTSAAILALDMEGKLYAHHIEINESTGSDDNDHLFDMELCVNNEVDDIKQKSSKRGRKSKAPTSMQSRQSGHPFTSMNTLTARMESATATNSKSNVSEKNSQESSCSTPKQKGRKRKATTPSKTDEGSRAVYAVAASLNESLLLPSQSPPVIIRLSVDNGNESDHKSILRGVTWSNIPGLEHVHSPMTCITFASRAACGNQLRRTLVSMMKCDEGQDHVETNIGDVDEGMVLMGFQDGSLYATTVIDGEP
eukprot:scaffold16451_cov78-Skeletonema_marinoi.AAC.2